jgi:hypothetical protein
MLSTHTVSATESDGAMFYDIKCDYGHDSAYALMA